MQKTHLTRLPALLAVATTALMSTAAFAADDPTANLPADLKQLYVGATSTMLPSAYDNYKAPTGAIKWCHSESYQGNPWRVTVTNELKRLVEASGASFEVSDSNSDTAQQINQIRSFIDKGCTVITSVAGSATALNDVIKAAYDKGIPFVTAAGSVTSPYALNVDSNYAAWGYDMIKAIGAEKGGKANILMVEGIAGNPIVAQEKGGADRALKEEPGLKVVRTVNGNWTANVTKSAVLQALATYPSPIDAVWTTGSESRVVAEAFSEAGRPTPLITGSVTGDAIGYWKANPDKYNFSGHGVLPHWTAETLYRVTERLLSGQKPKLNTLMMPIPAIKLADFDGLYKPCMTPDAISVFPIPATDPVPESVLDGYFSNPAPTKNYDYSKVPGAC
jgi:ribose transport system substrate-binding protein